MNFLKYLGYAALGIFVCFLCLSFLVVGLVQCSGAFSVADGEPAPKQRPREFNRRIPQVLAVEKILFQEERAWGMGGPGDNEVGFVVCEISPALAQAIKTQGLGYLKEAKNKRGWPLGPWYQTPMPPDSSREKYVTNGQFSITKFLDQYGFGYINIEEKYEKMTEEIMNTPGAFYYEGQGGLLIMVSPEKRILIYTYAG